jgi:hypothetical protein
MTESIMHQEWQTWLKPECVSEAIGINLASRFIGDNVAEINRLALLTVGHAPDEQLRSIKAGILSEMDDIIKEFEATTSDGIFIPTTKSRIYKVMGLLKTARDAMERNDIESAMIQMQRVEDLESPLAQYEAVVECQCGRR